MGDKSTAVSRQKGRKLCLLTPKVFHPSQTHLPLSQSQTMASFLCASRCVAFHSASHTIKPGISNRIYRAFSSFQPLRAEPVSVRASFTEKTQGRLDERNLEKAVRSVLHDGLVIVQDAVDTDIVDKLNKKMVADALKLRARGKDGPFNYNQGNLQQDAPPVKEHFHPDIFLSKSCPARLTLVPVPS